MAPRVGKVLFVSTMAVYFIFVVFNNITDYSSNFVFIKHVLSMDTIGPDSALRWRALTSPRLHHAFYSVVIGWEAAAGVLCALGALGLARALRAEGKVFNRAKGLATSGLVLAGLLWFLAFLVVGGEWFAMWQSPTFNGQPTAFSMFLVNGIVLILLLLPDPDL
jgi:predicted small integral membrane protein